MQTWAKTRNLFGSLYFGIFWSCLVPETCNYMTISTKKKCSASGISPPLFQALFQVYPSPESRYYEDIIVGHWLFQLHRDFTIRKSAKSRLMEASDMQDKLVEDVLPKSDTQFWHKLSKISVFLLASKPHDCCQTCKWNPASYISNLQKSSKIIAFPKQIPVKKRK